VKVKPRSPEETYGPAWAQARTAFATLSPEAAAARAGVRFHGTAAAHGWFEMPFFGSQYRVGWPDAEVSVRDSADRVLIAVRLLLVHYLTTADGTPMASRWITFRQVPGGLGYWAAFQGRSSRRLAQRFGSDVESFVRAAEALRGERLAFGDAAFMFRALPRVWMAVVLHVADEEFGPDVNLLFDGSADHYLPTEDLAVLGGMLATHLIQAGRA
jgi:hypothetical protein